MAVKKRKATRAMWTKKENLEKLSDWAEDGLSMKQIARKIGISRSTLYDWMNSEPDIYDSLAHGHTDACVRVENKLFLKCVGFKETVKKVIKVKKVEYDANGRKVAEVEEPTEVEEEIYIPPDSVAIKFYLTNRLPSKYRDKPVIEAEGNESESGVVVLPEANKMQNAECKMQN